MQVPQDLQAGWQTGYRYRYHFSIDEHSDTRPFELQKNAENSQGLEGRVQLDGAFSIDSVWISDSQTPALRIKIDTLSNKTLSVDGHNILDDKTLAGLRDASLIFTQSEDGNIDQCRAPAKQDENLTRLFHLLLNTWQMHLRPGQAHWDVNERDPHGQILRDYKLIAIDDRALHLQIKAKNYEQIDGFVPLSAFRQKLEAHSSLDLAQAGHIVEFKRRLNFRLNDKATHLRMQDQLDASLHFISREPSARQKITRALAATRALMDLRDPEKDLQPALQMRAAGLTGEQLLADLDKYNNVSKLPDHNRWLWRATGLLRLHPELCPQVADFAKRMDIGHEGRGLALDLLVGAGNEPAQAALIDALSDATMRRHPRYSVYFQRASLVTNPDRELQDFVSERYQNATGDEKTAAAFSLGSIANHLDQQGQRQQAEAISDPVAEALDQSEDPQQLANMIRALGNAGLLRDVPRIIAHAESPALIVRLAVAEALRKMIDPRADSCLVGLSADPVVQVAVEAFASLTQHPLNPDLLLQIDRQITSGQIQAGAMQSLLNLLQKTQVPTALRKQMLQHILQRSDIDIKARARAQAMLDQGV